MNILLYVVAMILILATLTYSKIQSFRTLMGTQTTFTNYMGVVERGAIDRGSHFWYDKIVVRSKKNGSTSERQAGSRLSFFLFLNQQEREKSSEVYQQTRELAKRLITTLYAHTDFYKEALQQRPQLLEALFNDLQVASSQMMEGYKITHPAAMLNLEFPSKSSHEFFYKILQGVPCEPKKKDDEVAVNGEEDSSSESDEAHATPGYQSLLDYITVRPTTQLRVFLASRELLDAIFGDVHIVTDVIEKRRALYQRVLHAKENEREKVKQEASKEFQDAFSHSGTAEEFNKLLNFNVTNTNPKSYE